MVKINSQWRPRNFLNSGVMLEFDGGVERQNVSRGAAQRQKFTGILVLSLVEKMVRRAGFHKAAFVHHVEVITHLGNGGIIPGQEEQGDAPMDPDVFEQIEDPGLADRVEVARGIVANEEARLGSEDACQTNPLAIEEVQTLGKLARAFLVQADELE